MFDAPSTNTTTGDTCRPKDVNGHLLVVVAKQLKPNFATSFGVTDAVAVDVADVDTGTVYLDTLFFATALVNGLRDKIGGAPVLARMGQGTAKNGQSAPWLLLDATGDAAAVAKASAWMEAHPDFLSTTPAPAPAPQGGGVDFNQVLQGGQGQLDWTTLPPEARAVAEKLYAQQQAGAR